MQRIQQLADLPKTTKLCPLPRNMLSKGRAAALAAGGQKRKHGGGQGEEAIPPPISRLGASGVPNFNDETFDMDGSRELAASMVGRETSNVGGAAAGDVKPPAEHGGLSTWGQPMPLPLDEGLNRDHSLALPGVGRFGSLSAMHGAGGLAPLPPPAGEVGHEMSFDGIGREMSFGFLDRGLSMGSVGRDMSMSIDFSPTTAPEGLGLGGAAGNGQGVATDAGQPQDQEEPAGKRQRTE